MGRPLKVRIIDKVEIVFCKAYRIVNQSFCLHRGTRKILQECDGQIFTGYKCIKCGKVWFE